MYYTHIPVHCCAGEEKEACHTLFRATPGLCLPQSTKPKSQYALYILNLSFYLHTVTHQKLDGGKA